MIRKGTDPGVAPPALGSVQPPPAPPPEGGWDPDETPTRPDHRINPETLDLVRLIGELSTVERRRLTRLIKWWSVCGIDRRVMIEELARLLSEGEKK